MMQEKQRRNRERKEAPSMFGNWSRDELVIIGWADGWSRTVAFPNAHAITQRPLLVLTRCYNVAVADDAASP